MIQHKQLASGLWQELHFFEQMAHVGSEVERAMKWRSKGKKFLQEGAVERALELLQLTIKNHISQENRLKELTRLRECLIDDFMFDNSYRD